MLLGCLPAPSTKKSLATNLELAPYDAIIVPGVPFYGDTLDQVMQMRVLWATHLYKEGLTKNVIYSGGAVYSPYYESKVMAIAGEGMGIPKEHIYIENRAEHSVENVYFSYLIAKNKGWENIALATDPYQTKVLHHFIEKHKLPVKSLPVPFNVAKSLPHPSNNHDFSAAALTDSNFVALPDKEGIFKRLSGTIGKNIHWHTADVQKKRLKRKYRRQGRLIE